MDKPLHNLDEALAELEKKTIRTSQGEFIKMDDVRRWAKERSQAREIEEETAPKPKNMNQAKQMILKDEKVMQNFPPPRREPGRAVPAQDPQSASRP